MSMDLNRKKSFIQLIYHQIQEKEPSHTNGIQGQWKLIANIRRRKCDVWDLLI